MWFHYDWLLQKPLAVPDLKEDNYVPLLVDKHRYANGLASGRHRIRNNLLGTASFVR